MNILITGAASGIGRAAAREYAARGHRVYALDLAFAELEGVRSFLADVTDEGALLSVYEALREEGTALDMILHFAGIHFVDNFLEITEARLQKIFAVNLLGAVRVNRIFFPLLNKGARIIITTSEVAPLAPLPFNGVYSVSKTALDAYAQALRHEAGFLGVRVITVRPGAVDTPLAGGSIPSMREMVEKSKYFSGQGERFEALMRKFTGRLLTPEQLAKRICAISLKRHPRTAYTVHANVWMKLLSLLPDGLQVACVRMLVNRRPEDKGT